MDELQETLTRRVLFMDIGTQILDVISITISKKAPK